MLDWKTLLDGILRELAVAASAERKLREQIQDWAHVLEAIRSRPGDDGPRMLAVQWLEDNLRAERAEFIRVQCILARLHQHLAARDGHGPEYESFVATERRLAEALRSELTEGLDLPELPVEVEGAGVIYRFRDIALHYARGFADWAQLSTPKFLECAPQLFRNHPVEEVHLVDKKPLKVPEGWWWADSCLDPTNPAILRSYVPPELYHLLLQSTIAGGYLGTGRTAAQLTYPTAEAALAALSRCCLVYGYDLAGIPGQAPPLRKK